MNRYILKACNSCEGDLARDCDDWICLQCGRYSYVGLYSQAETPVDSLSPLPANALPAAAGADSQRAGRGGGEKTAPTFAARGTAIGTVMTEAMQ